MRELMKKYYNLDFVKPTVPMNYQYWLHFAMDESSSSKAMVIFNEIFRPDDEIFLVVHSSEGYANLAPRQYRGDISVLEFYMEGKYHEETFEALADESYEESKFLVISIAINRKQVKVEPILKEILKTDFGGNSNLASTVFFINRRNHMIYHLYDDRGLYIMAPQAEELRPFYEQHKEWIALGDADKAQIMFKD